MSRPAKKAKRDETAPLPSNLASASLARFIDLDSFVQARQFELNHFLELLNDKEKFVGKTRQGFQTLPRHMRRRAMSHNTYRIPARVRVREESSAKAKGSTRKRRRRPFQILKDYCSRDKKHTWLETHIWHAKRMRMEAMWGYKLAVEPNEKGERACYRFAGSDCTLYESSYLVCLRVNSSLAEFAAAYTATSEVPSRVHNCTAAWDILLFDKSVLVAPVTVVPVDGQSFILIVHPAAYAQVKELLETQWQVEDLKDQLVCYKLRGPLSLKVILDSVEIREERVESLLRNAAMFNAYQFAANTLVGFSYKQHSQKGPMHSTPRPPAAGGGSLIPAQQSAGLLEALVNWPAELSATELWRAVKAHQVTTLVPTKITTRSRTCRFPPRERKKGEEPQKEEAESEESSSDEACEPAANFLPALLLFRKSPMKRGLGSGWDLLAPAGYGTTLWRRLVYAGGKTTGLREFEALALERGELSFPRDFPTTKAYEEFTALQAQLSRDKYDRTPSAHRVNPERIGFPHPFAPLWTALSSTPLTWESLLPVRIKAFRRRPVPNSLLCLPLPEDLERVKVPAHEERLHERTVNAKEATSAALESACSALATDREVIGVVTSGSFSHARGKGFGLGFVVRAKWSACERLLFRAPTSRCYHLAAVSLLSN